MADSLPTRHSFRWTPLRTLRFVIVVAFGVVLLLLETEVLAGVKVAFVWRSLLLALGAVIAFPVVGTKYPRFVLFGVVFALANLTAIGGQYDFVTQAVLTMKWLFLPVSFVALLRLRLDEQFLKDLLLAFSLAILLSCLPYYLGLLTSNAEVLDMAVFGSDNQFFVGPFQNTHSAAVSLALAGTAFLYFARMATAKSRTVLLLTCSAVAAALLLATYIRTGYLLFIIGTVVIWLRHLKTGARAGRLGRMFVWFVVGGLIATAGVVLVASDSVLIARLLDINKYQPEMSWATVGSGRLMFAYVALTAWWEAGILQKLFGIGWVDAVTYMNTQVGQAIFAHNLFADSLVQTGLVGLGAFLLMLRELYKEVKHSIVLNRDYELALVFLVGYVLYAAVQGSHLFTLDLYLAVALVLARHPCARET